MLAIERMSLSRSKWRFKMADLNFVRFFNYIADLTTFIRFWTNLNNKINSIMLNLKFTVWQNLTNTENLPNFTRIYKIIQKLLSCNCQEMLPILFFYISCNIQYSRFHFYIKLHAAAFWSITLWKSKCRYKMATNAILLINS